MSRKWNICTDDGEYFYFMNTKTYEQMHLTKELLGDATNYLIPNLRVDVQFYEGKPISVDLPPTVDLTVQETEPGIKRRDSFQRHQAGQDRDRPCGSSPAIHRGRRENSRVHGRRRLHGARVIYTPRSTAMVASSVLVQPDVISRTI